MNSEHSSSGHQSVDDQWITIASRKSFFDFDFLVDWWEYRELLFFLVWRDLRARYAQSFLGIGWVVLQPLLSTAILSVVFGRLVGRTSEVSYPLYSYVGMVIWGFFSNGISRMVNSMLANSQLVTKVYFPRILIPLSALIGVGMDFVIGMLIGIPLFLLFRTPFHVMGLPVFVMAFFVEFFLVFGAGLFLCALSIKFRDVNHVLPFFMQMLFFLTPVFYSIDHLPEQFRVISLFNPMSGLLVTMRSTIFGLAFSVGPLLVCLSVSVFVLAIGAFYFNRIQRVIADVI